MGTNTGIGIGIGIPFKNNVLGEGKPYLPPEIKDSLKAVVIAYGKTNNDSDRAIVKNLVDASNPFIISNAAFKLNSGFGKYETELSNTRIWTQSKETTSSPFSSNYNGLSGWIVFANTELTNSADMPSFKIQVKGLLEGQELIYRYYDSNGQSNVYSMGKDGEYTLPADIRTAKPQTTNTSGFQVVKNDTNTITITQIPSFVGAFVTDGIDDLITSTKTVQEMLGGSNEITVVSMMANLDSRQILCNSNFSNTNGYNVRNTLESNGVISMLGYTDKNGTTNNLNLIMGDKNSIKLVDKVNFNSDYVFYPAQYYKGHYQVAWYWTIIANKVLTTDEINQVIAYFNLDKTLKPDILCNITKQGITNDNHADFNDKLIDYSGNGRDIQMNNLAWKGGSGIAAKPFETIKDYTIVSDEARQELTIYNEFSYKVKSNTPNHYWTVQSIIKDNTSYQVTIITDKDCYWINSTAFTNNEGNKESIRKEYPVKANTPTQVTICGLNEFEYPEDIEPTTAVSYVNLNYAGEVTVTFIPSCKGGLLLDGVNDFGKVTGMPIYKDYTVVADREIEASDGGIVSKGNPGAFILELEANAGSCYSFGLNATNLNIEKSRKISYLSKYLYNGVSIEAGTAEDSDSMWLGTIRDGDSRFFNGVIYSLMSFPYSMSKFLIERQLKKHKLGTLYPNMVEFRPIIKANANYNIFYTALLPLTGNIWERINIGDYVPVGRRVAIQLSFDNEASELVSAISSQLGNISITKNSNNKGYTIFGDILKNKSPQKINITIDEYIRFEDIVQPYPALLRFNDENGNEVSWGGKFKVGSTITRIGSAADSNLLPNIYNIFGLLLNGNQVTSSKVIVEKTMVFKVKSTYIFDNNEPKCILSPRLLRIPNSSYKILGYIPDISGHGNHGKINNSAYAGASGANGYLQNFSGWTKASGVSSTDSVISSSNNLVAANGWIAYVKSGTVVPTFKVEISGIPINGNLRFEGSGQTLVNGVNTIQGLTTTKISGFYISSGYDNDWSNLRIEQVGEYEGAYCLDGVDDFVTIPTLSSGGKQVLMKVNWNTINSIIYDQRGSGGFAIYCSDYNTEGDSITVPAYKGRNAAGTTYIDGIRNEYIIASQLRNVTHNIVEILDTSYAAGKTNPIIGKSHMNSNYGSLALYDFMLFDGISTDDKIKELNEYVGIEAKVELPPYYWDAYGKTNLDGDKATIQQRGVSVGDYDLTNYNHAYEGMSGYNGYPVVFGIGKTYGGMPNADDFAYTVSPTTVNVTKFNITHGFIYSYLKRSGELETQNLDYPSYKIKVTGLEKGFGLHYSYLKNPSDANLSAFGIGTDGTYTIPKSFASDGSLINNNVWIGFIFTGTAPESCNVTIEVLPEYENGLAYDGVSDFTNNKNIPILTDFTFIIKREILSLETNEPMLVIKGDKVYNNGIGNAFILEHNSKGVNYVYSYGKLNQIERDDSKIIYLTPESYNGNPIIKGENGDNLGLILGKYWKGIIYKTILYSKTISLLEINFLKNLMEKDEIIDLNNPIFIKNE